MCGETKLHDLTAKTLRLWQLCYNDSCDNDEAVIVTVATAVGCLCCMRGCDTSGHVTIAKYSADLNESVRNEKKRCRIATVLHTWHV